MRPLAARSVILSLLLGAHPPELPARDIVRVVATFGVSEPTARVALTRMVAAGDLHRADHAYRLSERLVERQLRQDESVEPHVLPWGGHWEMAVVTGPGRPAQDRADLRTRLTALRLAPLRDGVWLRPANLGRPVDIPGIRRFRATPEGHPAELAHTLWDLPAWARVGEELLADFRAAEADADRFALAAAIVRHLVTDPILPADLLPTRWPAEDLRQVYRSYQASLVALVSAVRS